MGKVVMYSSVSVDSFIADETDRSAAHAFGMTDGWGVKPPSGIDHVVVVTHRPEPEGWDPEAPFHFVDGIEAAMAKAQEHASDRLVEVAAGDVGGQVLAAGLVDEVRMDVVPRRVRARQALLRARR